MCEVCFCFILTNLECARCICEVRVMCFCYVSHDFQLIWNVWGVFLFYFNEFGVCEMHLWGACDVFLLCFACISTNLKCVRCVSVVFWMHVNEIWSVREVFLVILQMHFNYFEVWETCFEVFFEMSERRFVWNSLALVRKEVFHPVWALYNIKEELGHLSCARTRRPAWSHTWQL